ncbi:MAG: hypothetical protein APF81_17635 [Desulfosporosinus sp. BRH_c37]|nr:MAG: hypothetical protein APF81_17635 [Desulfosporosinus sp. BRH_c37]
MSYHHCQEIIYLGGEPSLHPNFAEILCDGSAFGLTQTIITNGQNLTSEFASFLSTIPNLQVGISLHGPSAQIHDGLTNVPGSRDKVLRTVSYLEEKKVSWHIQISVLRDNFELIEEIYSVVAVIGRPERLDLSRMVAEGRGHDQNGFLSELQWKEVFVTLDRLKRIGVRCKIESFPRCWVLEVAKERNLNYQLLKECLRPCSTWLTQIPLDYNGNARFCPTGGLILGNILSDGLLNVWQNNPIIHEYREFGWLDKPCLNRATGFVCSDFAYCSGGCRRTFGGDMFQVDSLLHL